MSTWAFWGYDLFPELLGGKVARRQNPPGYKVYVTAYQGWFLPEFEVDGEAGKLLLQELEELTREYQTVQAELKSAYLSKRDELIKNRRGQ